MSLVRFGISLEDELLGKFDGMITRKGYTNRSEAIRDLIRDAIVQEDSRNDATETAGTLTLVYSHHAHELADTLTELQHTNYKSIVSTMHIHLDEHNCLEVLILKGKGNTVRSIADRLIGIKGVKHGKLTVTTTGKSLK